MRHELDMTGCKRLGILANPRQTQTSICWGCQRPSANCRWLRLGIPYEGAEFWERRCSESEGIEYSIYAIMSCPMEVKSE